MIAVKKKTKKRRKDAKLANDLEKKHRKAIDAGMQWNSMWQLFYEHPWFVQRLSTSSLRLFKTYRLPHHWKDDVTQEALLVFARSLQRNITLGFDDSRGEFAAFLSTIIYRCCQKGLRQFRRSTTYSLIDESAQTTENFADDLIERIDLQDRLSLLPEPYKMTATMICQGRSISEIADQTNRSPRTIYRWLETATNLLRDSW